MTLNNFQGRLNTEFTLKEVDKPFQVTLVEVTSIPTSMREGGGFSLLFQSNEQQILNQGMYTVNGDDFEQIMFLVPVGTNDTGVTYEVIFN